MPVNVSYVSVVPPPEGALNERGETAYNNNKKTNDNNNKNNKIGKKKNVF